MKYLNKKKEYSLIDKTVNLHFIKLSSNSSIYNKNTNFVYGLYKLSIKDVKDVKFNKLN